MLARGGGSFEDLLPFSDEAVVRAVAGSRVPIVSAVGHEQDTPLCDLAADARAATPTAAGALVVPDLARARGGARADAPTARLAVLVRSSIAISQPARTAGRAASSGASPPARASARSARSRGRAAAGALAARHARPRLRDRPRRRRRSPGRVGVRAGDALEVQLAAGSLGARPSTRCVRERRPLHSRSCSGARGDRRRDSSAATSRSTRRSRSSGAGEELYKECVARLQSAELRIEELAPPSQAT